MDRPGAPAGATPHASRVRSELVTTYTALERACAVLGAGGAILHDGDRADALRQLRSAQELIRGVGERVRREAGL